MDFAMAIHALLFKNTKGVFPIEGFRHEVYLREFTGHCVILVLFRVFLCSLKGRWPPRSPDLTPLDYYIWGHMKTSVYETKVDSRSALRDRIFSAAEHIRNQPNNIGSAAQSLLLRAENFIAPGGGHFEQLL